ncbi:CgeB family protein [Parapedobacter sp. DT-150]|uniref:CgeB family protein n=1 Tax=Parapedobacter sp. DT-150 TaxID=3396162 RepID=UPI003F1D197C
MKILSVGNMSGLSNTCLHRHWALEKVADIIDVVNTSEKSTSLGYRIAYHLFWRLKLPIRLPDISGANMKIRELVRKANVQQPYDIVWIDKGITINPETLQDIKQLSPKTKIVSYSPDNMALRHNQSQNYLNCLPLYDHIFTNKSYILDDMRRLGAKDIKFENNSYESKFHYPHVLTNEEVKRLGGDVGFIGMWEKERGESISYLAKNGIKVKVFGDGRWNKYKGAPNFEILPGVFSEDYSKALQAFKISLCFLRKLNFDQQTTRTMEIPACGGFMLAERTEEHLALFEEGKEAAFFSSDEELLEKCIYYLAHDDDRKKIAKAGTLRCETSGYSNEKTIKRLIEVVMRDASN